MNRIVDQYMPVDENFTDGDLGVFTVAYACDTSADDQDLRDCMQWTVVDQLIGICNVTFCFGHFYHSTFNTWSDLGTQPGNPGHLATQSDSDNLLANLANGNIFQALTKNFYFFGHANPGDVGTMDPNVVHLTAHDVATQLGNLYFYFGNNQQPNSPIVKPGTFRDGQAYRLVFLDGCCTAMNSDWAHAFGVYDRINTKQLANWPEQVQAYVGWTGEKKTPNSKFDMANCYSVFWSAWQNGLPLDRCIWFASQDHPPAPLNFEDLSDYNFGLNYQHWHWYEPLTYVITGTRDPRLRIYGYAGITRTGYQPGYDNSAYYK